LLKGTNKSLALLFIEMLSPVASDTTIRAAMVISLKYQQDQQKWLIEVIDVEAAFLNAKLEEDIWTEIPETFRKCSLEKVKTTKS
jgi:hypothetical protein